MIVQPSPLLLSEPSDRGASAEAFTVSPGPAARRSRLEIEVRAVQVAEALGVASAAETSISSLTNAEATNTVVTVLIGNARGPLDSCEKRQSISSKFSAKLEERELTTKEASTQLLYTLGIDGADTVGLADAAVIVGSRSLEILSLAASWICNDGAIYLRARAGKAV